MTERVRLDHGEGGSATHKLVREVFASRFGTVGPMDDSALVEQPPGGGRIAFTTDAFVVRPRFFPGGDIGRLAIFGTVNDLATTGAEPLAIAAAFVLEEGLPLDDLIRIADGMAAAAASVPVRVVAGDTKVVGRGEADGVFIITTGIGSVPVGLDLRSDRIRPCDAAIVSGPVGDHGIAVLGARGEMGFSTAVESDCGSVLGLARAVIRAAPGVRCMRDPTRGGLATAVHELAESSGVTIVLDERAVPVRPVVRHVCDAIGLDPLYVACEGRLIAVVPAAEADAALAAMRALPEGSGATRIGAAESRGRFGGLLLRTALGGTRPMMPLEGAQLPRIC